MTLLLMPELSKTSTGAYSARKVIPKDIRAAYAAKYGNAWEEKFRLDGGASAHEARARYGEWLADIETRIGSLRAAKKNGPQPLTRQNAYALAGRWYAWFIAKNEKDLRTPAHWRALADTLVWDVIRPHAPDEYEEHPQADPHWDWQADPRVREEVRPAIAAEAQTAAFLLEQGLSLTPDATNLFLDAVSDNLLPAFQRLEAVARGDYSPDVHRQVFPQFQEVSGSPPVKAMALFEAWTKAVQPAEGTVYRWTTVFKEADRHFPDVRNISFDKAKTWMNGLINEERSAATVAAAWRTALKTVFGWGVAEKMIDNNPFPEVRISVPRKNTERETKAFDDTEIKIILAAALRCDDTKSYRERAFRWVPWICAYTGARAGEITQLRATDIQQRNGMHFAKLTPSAGKIKTRKARTVPLHEHLIEQGFLDFVERAQGQPLFYPAKQRPVAKVEDKPRQSPAERMRSQVGTWVRSLGITDPEISPNHAWRHTFKAMAARVSIDERYSDAITGHSPATIGRAYTKPLPEDLAEALKKFPRYRLD
ncbi:tyrosine-type recombinase/integrase [Bradyrhizobium sp. WSM1253]|uniref:tyrosine-type recombinase/integrase n=1 Tax=Bradyrhizobium sp. WSM1253 TaxID=319003 RepID=UPI00025D2F5C|nr:tyrosine-type recombinase/integrase [Bradyrhizobium sp. WSM1253]EIG63244.1 site-specific recombinase XerD [Bradyrhizobium sp. WSM1253]